MYAQAELPLLALRAAAEQVVDQPKELLHDCILTQVVVATLDQLPLAVALPLALAMTLP
jgi:hypothetical protein